MDTFLYLTSDHSATSAAATKTAAEKIVATGTEDVEQSDTVSC